MYVMTLPSGDAITSFQGEHRWLSNFWHVAIQYEGDTFPSVEHAYQAAKTLDPLERAAFRLPITAGKAKGLSKKLVLRPEWPHIRLQIMEDLVRQKFQDKELREKLLATGNRQLIEGNEWNDSFWGVSRGKGMNYLGRIIMKVRQELQTAKWPEGESNTPPNEKA